MNQAPTEESIPREMGTEKWGPQEMGIALIFNHFYTQKCGLDESSPYRGINPKRNGDSPHFYLQKNQTTKEYV